MPEAALPIDYNALVETGISLTIRLNRSPVTAADAEAFFRYVNNAIEEQRRILGDKATSIVPVIEVGSGSIKAKIRFLAEKTGQFAGDVAKEVARTITSGLVVSMLSFPGATTDAPGPPQTPHIESVAIQELVSELDRSSRGYTIEVISEGRTVIIRRE